MNVVQEYDKTIGVMRKDLDELKGVTRVGRVPAAIRLLKKRIVEIERERDMASLSDKVSNLIDAVIISDSGDITTIA